MQIQTQLADASSSTNILEKPEHLLMFVKHALEDAQSSKKGQPPATRPKRTGLGLEDLRIVQDSDCSEGEAGSGDSDDEDEGSANAAPDEIMVTAMNLLLAILEGNFYFTSDLVYCTHSKSQQTLSCLPGQTLC